METHTVTLLRKCGRSCKVKRPYIINHNPNWMENGKSSFVQFSILLLRCVQNETRAVASEARERETIPAGWFVRLRMRVPSNGNNQIGSTLFRGLQLEKKKPPYHHWRVCNWLQMCMCVGNLLVNCKVNLHTYFASSLRWNVILRYGVFQFQE